jgi:hypothetical protein
MAFVLTGDLPLKNGSSEDVDCLRRKREEYRKYLLSVRGTLPASAFEFATASWRDGEDHRDLHDSWVESLTIHEIASGDRGEERSLEIHVRLLGAYHDGHTMLSYKDVQSYAIETPKHFDGPPSHVGHGDWLADEVTLSRQNFVQHEIEFSRGSRWHIECRDIECGWHPVP